MASVLKDIIMALNQNTAKYMSLCSLIYTVAVLQISDAIVYKPEIINKTVTHVNKLFASTDVDSAIHCALKCRKFNCTSFTYGEKLGVGDCYKTKSNEYNGRQSTTNSGTVCQRWDSMEPHYHEHIYSFLFPDYNVSEAQNFCRDPDEEGTPWCFTVNPEIRMEACPVKKCTYKFQHDGCYEDGLSSMNYTGSKNYTRSGKACQRWDTQTPHNHSLMDEDFLEADISDVENYCRDPTSIGYTWCYTTDPDTRWEPCDVSSCTKYRNDNICFNDDKYIYYRGQWDITINDIKCQRWDVRTPHVIPVGEIKCIGESATDANNYCRSIVPFRNDSLYCYSTDPNYALKRCEGTKCPPYHATCYDGPSVKSYMGSWNKTMSGRTCQRWDKQMPHSHNLTAEMFQEDKLEDAENFCRDPTNSGRLWCYTIDPKIEKETCGIGKCSGEKTCQLFNDETIKKEVMRNYIYLQELL